MYERDGRLILMQGKKRVGTLERILGKRNKAVKMVGMEETKRG